MTGLPISTEATISSYLDALQSLFIPGTKVTFIARPPLGPGKDGDVVMTDDDLVELAAAIGRRAKPEERPRMIERLQAEAGS